MLIFLSNSPQVMLSRQRIYFYISFLFPTLRQLEIYLVQVLTLSIRFSNYDYLPLNYIKGYFNTGHCITLSEISKIFRRRTFTPKILRKFKVIYLKSKLAVASKAKLAQHASCKAIIRCNFKIFNLNPFSLVYNFLFRQCLLTNLR